MIRSGASIGPKAGTGALCQFGSLARQFSRKPTSRGQRGQLREGSAPSTGTGAAREGSVLVIVAARPLRDRAALEELRGVLTLLTRRPVSGTFSWIAADLSLQLDDVDELVGLAAQFVGDHRRLRG